MITEQDWLIRPRDTEGDEHLIPLINIVFLLLIFFLVAGTMVDPKSRQVQLPVSGAGSHSAPDEQVVTISADGTVQFRQKEINLTSESSIRNLIQQTGSTVTLRADHRLLAGELSPIVSRLRTFGADAIRLRVLTNEGPPDGA